MLLFARAASSSKLQTMADIRTEALTDAETERLKKAFPNRCANQDQPFIRIQQANYVFPIVYEKFKVPLKTWNVRCDDIYVTAFPKNGTTWTQELVWCIQNECDIEKAKSTQLMERVPFLEAQIFLDIFGPTYFDDIANMASPRILKTHLALSLLPDDFLEKSKVVLCLRNPKDTVVSFYYHCKLWKHLNFVGDFKTFFDLFMDNIVYYGSYFDYVCEMWGKKDHSNMCVLFYEEMKSDLAGSIRKVANFFKKEITDSEVQMLVDHLSFKKMKENKCINLEPYQKEKVKDEEGSFIRKGEVGDWKNYFTEEMNERMDEAIERHFKPIGLEFRYE